MSETPHPLEDVRSWLGRFIKPIDDSALDLAALWVALSHVNGQLRTVPRLLIESPLPGSGKTTLLEHLEALCHRPSLVSNALTASSAANLARQGGTILIDEADKSIGSGSDTQRALLGIVNAGYKASGTYAVNVADEGSPTGWSVVEVPVYGMVAMAGISMSLPEDTLSRCLRIRLLPDTTGLTEETDWEALEVAAEALRKRLEAWASETALASEETLPPGVTGRLREVWRGLKRVADATGGRWPDTVDRLATRHLAELAADREEGLLHERPHIVLVRDIYGIWPEPQEYTPTSDIIDLLHLHAPTVWGADRGGPKALSATVLGRMLTKNYGIYASRRSQEPRGYYRIQFVPVWEAVGLADRDCGNAAA